MTMQNERPLVRIVGAGLAGSEAAWQAVKNGARVELFEMKPEKYTPAHHYSGFAELVCSNSFRSADVKNAIGLLKEELKLLGSLIMEAAGACEVPAGSAMAVDRVKFSDYITAKIKSCPYITVKNEEVTTLPEDGVPTVIATGPLTSDALAEKIADFAGEQLHFYDAAAPIVDASCIDMSRCFFASRYGKGDPMDYLNCPMTEDEYVHFYHELLNAETATLKSFDDAGRGQLQVFEGCMPVEVMAQRGVDTLRFGPMKPVGLPLPETGKEAYAVVQLRRENLDGTMYNLVGFQTHLTFGEQRRVFRMIPGLENAEFLRYGVMHRNTYLSSPRFLTPQYAVKKQPTLFFAGQMTGVEGYIESTSSGYVAGVNVARTALGKEPLDFPATTEIGALGHYVSESVSADFQPMNANFGIIEQFSYRVKGGKMARNLAFADRSFAVLRDLLANM